MHLSRKILGNINSGRIEIPHENIFDLPEKLIQFGTGALLRGLPDYFIDKANKQKIFNGRIVLIKSTESGGAESFEKQDCLYTHISRGVELGQPREERIINASISRILVAKTNWNQVLECAENPDMQIVVSNSTEAGLALLKEDIFASPPDSFPGKLLSFLYHRYTFFQQDPGKGLVIIPTELLPQNADQLKTILVALGQFNNLENTFLEWLVNANYFCNSLVDRIVPGKLSETDQKEMMQTVGYSDDLMIISESYRFWAIESASEKVRDILSFAAVDEAVVIAQDISSYSKLKLHILNGAHTFCCGLAYLAGIRTVKEAMDEESFSGYLQKLIFQEIIPALVSDGISLEQAEEFAWKTLDRFRNPFIVHHWLSISTNYSTKMRLRNLPTILNYAQRFQSIPSQMVLGFAGYLLFMKPVETDGSEYYGKEIGRKYPIHDLYGAYYYDQWTSSDTDTMLLKVLKYETLWGTDLTLLKGFAEAVRRQLHMLLQKGVTKAIEKLPAAHGYH